MTSSIVRLTLAAFVASATLAYAQHAVPRGGGGGGGSSSSGGSHSGGSSAGSTASSSGSSGGSTMSAGGDSGGGRAVPRHPTTASSGGGSYGGDGAGGRNRIGGSSGGYVDRSPNGAPLTSRPQGDNPTTGYAVPRGTVNPPPGRPGGGGGYYPIYPPYYGWYNPWGWGSWGLGYVWDPCWYGSVSCYGAPIYGGGYGYGAGGGYADSDSVGYAGDYRRDDVGQGALRIKVKPREARVLVDGQLAGTVDDFDGKFQKLELGAGTHKVRLEAEGYEPLAFDILIVDGQTVNYKGQMRKN